MSEEYGFFNAVKDSDGNYDRIYNASSFSELFSNFIGNGVYYNPTNQLKVVENSGLSITVRKGKAFINGYWYNLTEDATLVISANETASAQTVVVTCTLDLSQRLINIGYRKGESTPIRTGTKYELVLAVIQLGVGVSSITNSMIEDKRPDSNYCGYVTNLLGDVDFTEVFTQYQKLFDEQYETNESDFQAWFDNIKGKLSTDQAGNLQLQVNDLKQKNDEHEEKITNHEEKITNLETKMSGLLDFFYPVGTIYETENLSFDPNKKWGGSWKRIKGRVLVGVDEEDTDFSMSGKTGGSKTHTLTTKEIPKHTHSYSDSYTTNGSGNTWLADGVLRGDNKIYRNNMTYYTGENSSGGGAHNNLQPYITCYMWERIG